MNIEIQNSPGLFRVIGVGHGLEEVFEKIKGFGLEGVSAEIVNDPFDCTPGEEDLLAIIVTIDCDDNANRIAKTFHDAGVLTIGFNGNTVPSYYDSVTHHVSSYDIPEIIKTLLQPLVTECLITYDFNDLNNMLRNSDLFLVKSANGNSVKEATENLISIFNEFDFNCLDYVSLHLYFNPKRPTPIDDMASIPELMSKLPDKVNTIWGVYNDNEFKGDELKLSAILAGKELWKRQ